MWLSQVSFSRWSEDRPLTGSVKFNGNEGNIECSLAKEEIDDLMICLGKVLIKHSQSAAKRLEQASMASLNLLLESKTKVEEVTAT